MYAAGQGPHGTTWGMQEGSFCVITIKRNTRRIIPGLVKAKDGVLVIEGVQTSHMVHRTPHKK